MSGSGNHDVDGVFIDQYKTNGIDDVIHFDGDHESLEYEVLELEMRQNQTPKA